MLAAGLAQAYARAGYGRALMPVCASYETGVAEAVVALDEPDADRLADFIRESAPSGCEPCDAPDEAVTELL
jgi:hypothetical protein